jgi:serine/threonine-protein kinase HipA
MARDIGVWLFGQSVGTLSLLNGRLSFQYHHDGLALPNAVALSQSLPLVPEPFDDHQCRAFFAGLLPEGNLLRISAHRDRRFRDRDRTFRPMMTAHFGAT